jgi:hypothetical protein
MLHSLCQSSVAQIAGRSIKLFSGSMGSDVIWESIGELEPVMHFHNKKAIEWMNFANISIAKATK